MSVKRTCDELLSPDQQGNRAKRHMINSPTGLGVVQKINLKIFPLVNIFSLKLNA